MCGLAAVLSVVAHAADDTGADWHLNHCAACHGASGEGGGPVAVAMSGAVPNLRSCPSVTAVFFPPTRLPLTRRARAQGSSRRSADAGMGRRVSRARARHRRAHGTPSRRRTRGVPRDATVSLAGAGKAAVTHESRQITVGILPTKLLEQRHRLALADPARLGDRQLVVSHGHIPRSPALASTGCTSAPLSTRKRTIWFQPFCAAPCNAVLPLGGRYA